MRKLFYLFICLFAFSTGYAAIADDAQHSYVVEVMHQTPEALLPALKSHLDDSDSISAFGHNLIITTTAPRMETLRALISQLDTPAHNLLIMVRNNNDNASTDSSSGLSGGIRQGKVFVGTGQPLRGQRDGLTIRSDGLAYSTITTTRSASSEAEQQVRALEGSPAFIYTGESRQLNSRDAYGNPVSSQVDANKGFYVTARLIGDQVMLDIEVSNDEFDDSMNRGTTISTERLSTTVSGPVGEWISLGGITLSDHNRETSQVKKITTRTSNLGDISIKIMPQNP